MGKKTPTLWNEAFTVDGFSKSSSFPPVIKVKNGTPLPLRRRSPSPTAKLPIQQRKALWY